MINTNEVIFIKFPVILQFSMERYMHQF